MAQRPGSVWDWIGIGLGLGLDWDLDWIGIVDNLANTKKPGTDHGAWLFAGYNLVRAYA